MRFLKNWEKNLIQCLKYIKIILKKEYAEFRKNSPPYNDTFELLAFLPDDIKNYQTIRVKVRRTDDNKFFTLRLDELKAADEESSNYSLLEVYTSWAVNY